MAPTQERGHGLVAGCSLQIEQIGRSVACALNRGWHWCANLGLANVFLAIDGQCVLGCCFFDSVKLRRHRPLRHHARNKRASTESIRLRRVQSTRKGAMKFWGEQIYSVRMKRV